MGAFFLIYALAIIILIWPLAQQVSRGGIAWVIYAASISLSAAMAQLENAMEYLK